MLYVHSERKIVNFCWVTQNFGYIKFGLTYYLELIEWKSRDNKNLPVRPKDLLVEPN